MAPGTACGAGVTCDEGLCCVASKFALVVACEYRQLTASQLCVTFLATWVIVYTSRRAKDRCAVNKIGHCAFPAQSDSR